MSENNNQGGTNGNKGAKETDNRKQSLYFSNETLQQMQVQAARLDRSLSWVVARAWKVARKSIEALPSMDDTDEG